MFRRPGVTECTRRLWRALGARLGWSNLVDEEIMEAAERREHNEWYKPSGTEVRLTPGLREWLEAQADAELEPDGAAALAHAEACDAPLYFDGLLHAGLLGPTAGEPAAPGGEDEWMAEAARRAPNCAG